MAASELRRLEALTNTALKLARTTPSGRLALAALHELVEPEWLPGRLAEELPPELEAAHARACAPIKPRDVEKALKAAWGAKPTDELDDLDTEPAAVTPTSQVHRGELDGSPVAVKVLRPGVASSLRQDLGVLDALLVPLGDAFPAVDPRALLREARERLLDELDLEHEAGVQRHFHRALRDHPAFAVPAPVTALSHEGVLVSDWIDGRPVTESSDPDRAAARVIAFFLGAGRLGVVHADARPDDVLELADGRLAVLDFGATRPLEAVRVDHAVAATEALIAADGEAFGTALAALGGLPAEEGAAALALARSSLGELAGQSRLDVAAVTAARRRVLDEPEALARLIVRGSIEPADLWPLRGAAQAFGLAARIGGTGDWPALARDALRDGWG